MWIKDAEGNYIRGSELALVRIVAENNEYTLNVVFKSYKQEVKLRSYHRKEDAEAARDELIRKLLGEVVI